MDDGDDAVFFAYARQTEHVEVRRARRNGENEDAERRKRSYLLDDVERERRVYSRPSCSHRRVTRSIDRLDSRLGTARSGRREG